MPPRKPTVEIDEEGNVVGATAEQQQTDYDRLLAERGEVGMYVPNPVPGGPPIRIQPEMMDGQSNLEGTPLGSISGANAQGEARRTAEARRQQELGVKGLRRRMPGQEDLQATYTAPEYEQMNFDFARELGDSQAGQAYADDAAVQAQLGALQAMQGIYDSGGMTSADAKNLQKMQMMNSQQARGQREAVMQNMAERGMGGSGAQIMGLLGANDSAIIGNTIAGADVANAASLRALQALQGVQEGSGAIRDASFNEAFKRGGALDDWTNQTVSYRAQQAQYNNAIQNRQADVTAETANANEDARVGAVKDQYGYDVDATALELGQYDKEVSDAQNLRDSQDKTASDFWNTGAKFFNFGSSALSGGDDDDEGISKR